MKAELLKRLFRTINDTNDRNFYNIALAIIENERAKGHAKLAKQLEAVLNTSIEKYRPNKAPSTHIERCLKELPTNRRYNQPLLTLIPQVSLQHHMILPSHIEERFIRIEKEYAARERLAKFGLKPKRKILLYGPPGCGKSMGAERLAWNTGLPLLKVRFDTIISSYFGESATNLRSVFEASLEEPCLLLLDECDFIARSRTNRQDVGEVPRIVNTLLILLEEYNAPGLFVATTNIESSLDNALFRRFDDVFEIPKPDKKQIKQLLEMTLSSMNVSKDIYWQQLVERMKGCSAAYVVAAAQNAAKHCILESEIIIEQKHLEKAISEIEIFK